MRGRAACRGGPASALTGLPSPAASMRVGPSLPHRSPHSCLAYVSCRVARTAGFYTPPVHAGLRLYKILTLHVMGAQEVTAAIYELLAGQAWWRRYEPSPNMPNRPYFTALLHARGALAAPERARLRDFGNSVMGAPRARRLRRVLWFQRARQPRTLSALARRRAQT